MSNTKIYAVVTGDVIDSSQVKGEAKDKLNESLKEAFRIIKERSKNEESLPSFDIFRGDSFQGVLSHPAEALTAGLLIRASLRKNKADDQKAEWDARIAIGVGTIDYLPENISEGDGPAYQNSGPVLDELKGDNKFAITVPWQPVNDEFKPSCALLDAVINKWTQPQAEIIYMLLQEKTPKKIGEELDISQAAVHYRIKGAGWFAIKKLLSRYKNIIQEH
jgi:hypothetical protein